MTASEQSSATLLLLIPSLPRAGLLHRTPHCLLSRSSDLMLLCQLCPGDFWKHGHQWSSAWSHHHLRMPLWPLPVQCCSWKPYRCSCCFRGWGWPSTFPWLPPPGWQPMCWLSWVLMRSLSLFISIETLPHSFWSSVDLSKPHMCVFGYPSQSLTRSRCYELKLVHAPGQWKTLDPPCSLAAGKENWFSHSWEMQ